MNDWPTDERVEAVTLALLEGLVAREKLEGRWQLSLTITDDAGIRRINREWRGRDSATDVLSFPQFAFYNGSLDPDEAGFPPAGERNLLGDIVISHETCQRQGLEIGHGTGDELARLLVHGLLHLVGYDHERSSAEEKLMQAREDRLLADCPDF